jgi:hypothetical protein
MIVLNRFLFLLALLLVVSGSTALYYMQARELEPQVVACHKMQLRQVAAHGR